MDGSKPGELGVLAWCNSVRLSIAKDPGREFLQSQIQKQGFDFLESYREGVISRHKEEPVFELLKTPSRKKDASKKMRSAAAMAARVKAANAALQEDVSIVKENVFPTNEFHKALLQAKSNGNKSSSTVEGDVTFDDMKISNVITIDGTSQAERIEVDELQAHGSQSHPDAGSTALNVLSADTKPQVFASEIPFTDPAPTVLREDNGLDLPAVDTSMELTSQNEATAEPTPSVHEEEGEPTSHAHLDMEIDADFVPEQLPAHDTGAKELSMIMEGDELEEPVYSGLPVGPPTDVGQEIAVPLRDEPSSNTLKRKPSMSSFSGLPAPSPLARKSMRMSREPSSGQGLSAGPSLTHTPAAGPGSKRTSWLSKAKQTKALEVGGSGKRSGAVGDGRAASFMLNAGVKDFMEGNKGKGGETLGLGFVFPQSNSFESEDVRKTTASKLPEDAESASLKGKQKATSLDGDIGQAISQRPEHQTSLPLPLPTLGSQPTPFHTEDDLTVHSTDLSPEDDVLDRLKKTVEDLGARVGKGMDKSLGGNAAAALAEMAEARAAAAARVAQRTREEGGIEVESEETSAEATAAAVEVTTGVQVEGSIPEMRERLSLSELTPIAAEVQKPEYDDRTGSKDTGDIHNASVGDASTSTTPPNSPPRAHVLVPPSPMPVFTKPSTVFTVPTSSHDLPASSKTSSKDSSAKLPTTNPFSLPAKTLNIPAAFLPSVTPFSFGASALSAQSSKAAVLSDDILPRNDSGPAWMHAAQTTDFSIPISQDNQAEDIDADDSWHVDDKFQSNQTWTPFGFTSSDKDDGSTWSTFARGSTSQRGEDTGFAFPTESLAVSSEEVAAGNLFESEIHKSDDEDAQEPAIVDLNSDHDNVEENMDMDMDIDDTGESPDLDDLVMSGKPTITLVKSKPESSRSNSQLSMASSSSSSQAQTSLFGQASRFVSNMLGTSKKPVKSLALAAAAAKKQQEEAEKKAMRMKEMENRRQLALQRKAEEEKTRAAEEERKLKEDVDRRKREREEHTDKRPLKSLKKADDDTTKKRKLTVEIEKKPDTKKPPSKDNQTSRNAKTGVTSIPTSTTKAGGTFKHLAKQPSVTSLTASVQKPSEVKPAPKPQPSSSNLRSAAGKGKAKAADLDDVQPAQLVQSQMAHRAKAQIQAATPRQPPPVTSESIELPDINSEYSDSEDEDRPRTFDPPEWAQSPELRQALEQQSHMNPDEIFGRIGPLRMEDMFRTRQSRFRSRTSSANWSGPDQLTAEEEREYARRMGFK